LNIVHIEISSCPKQVLFIILLHLFINKYKVHHIDLTRSSWLYCIAFFLSCFFLLLCLIWLTKFIVQVGTCAMHTLQTYRVYLAQKHVQLSLVRRWMRKMKVKNHSFEIHHWFLKNQALDIRELTSPHRRVWLFKNVFVCVLRPLRKKFIPE